MLYLSTESRRTVTSCNVNYSPEGYYHPDRIINEYDFLYMLEGSWDIYEQEIEIHKQTDTPHVKNETCYHLDAGKLLILEPGHHHFSRTKSTPNMRNMFIHCNILTGDHTVSDAHTSETLSAVSDNPVSVGNVLRLHKLSDCSQNHQITNLYEQIIESYWSHNPHRELRTSALLELFLTELSLIGEEDILSEDYLTREIIQRFNSQPERFLSPKELARDYNCSIRTLSGRFKKATGMSLHQYQLHLKLSMAHEQIPLNPGRGLRDIALSFGFYDEFQFSKLYKRQFGYSPSRRR